MELWDSGIVKYYELPPTADVTLPEDSDWDHVNMIPKDTLVVFYARIIDVTTLRDLHVGLPRGSYGFLFRGQRLLAHELMVPCHPPESVQPRDFFCAVGTLEEAQTWVVALQWAASVWKRSSFNIMRSPDVSRTNLTPRVANLECLEIVDTNLKRNDMDYRNRKKQKFGRIVVTKVQQCRLVRIRRLQWEAAYEIELLLLQHTGEKVQSGTLMVEEITLLKTPQDLQKFLSRLVREIGRSQSSRHSALIQKMQALVMSLPRLSLSPNSNDRVISSFSGQPFKKSIQVVDAIFRTCAMDAAIINSQAMKNFMLVSVDDESANVPRSRPCMRWLDFHGSQHNSVIFQRVMTLPACTTMDDFAREWLLDPALRRRNRMFEWRFIWFLTHPLAFVGSLGILIVSLILSFAHAYRISMVSIRIRVDFLMISWLFAALLGSKLGHIFSVEFTERSQRRSDLTALNGRNENNHEDSCRAGSIDEGQSDDSVAEGDIDSLAGEDEAVTVASRLSSPLPKYPANGGESCWSIPEDGIFRVRGVTYLEDRVKIQSGPSPFFCRGVDVWLTDNPERHIARHPDVLGGKLLETDTFLVNFLLPFGNFVSYFSIPPIDEFPSKELASVWTKFLNGDQQYRDARLKLLPVVVDGPWIVKAAVGNGTSPALLGKVIPIQYFFRDPSPAAAGVYEVDVIITASSIAKGILSVVKGHTKSLTIAFAFIIEAVDQDELPETVLCAFQVHALHLEDCPHLPHWQEY